MAEVKHLKLKRNSSIANSRNELKNKIAAITGITDGEILIGRYLENSLERTLIAISQTGNTGSPFEFFDTAGISNDLLSEIQTRQKIEGQSGNTYAPNVDSPYINNVGNLNDADVKLADAISALRAAVKAEKYVTDVTFTGITDANGKYSTDIANKYTVKHNDLDTDSETEFTVSYNNISPTALTVPITIGDIAQGTTCASLAGKSVSEILDMIIFKTLYPTIPSPTAIIAFTNGYTNNGLLEIGSACPADSNIACVLNRGNISITALTSEQDANRTPIQLHSVGEGTATAYTHSNSTIVKGSNTVYATVSYGNGDQPLDSKGKNYNSPIEAGSVKSNTLNIFGVYPWYTCTGVTAGGTAINSSKQDLSGDGSGTNTIIVKLSENGAELASKVGFSLPLNKAVSIMKYNTVSGKYDIDSLNDFTQTQTTRKVQNTDTVYYDIMCNLGALGAADYQVTYNE